MFIIHLVSNFHIYLAVLHEIRKDDTKEKSH